MSELSNTSYLILGMLDAHPHSGYDIKSIADHSTRFFWAISYGQIYPELTRLESLGYAEVESESTAGRARRVFRITAKGRGALKRWLEAEGEDAFEVRDELLLKLFFVSDAKTRRLIAKRIKARHQAVLATLRGVEKHLKEVPHARRVKGSKDVLRGGLRLHQAIYDWAQDLENEPTHTS